MVLFESSIYLGNINIDQEINASTWLLQNITKMVDCRFNALTQRAHAAWMNNYPGPSLHGFHIWSNDAILYAKPSLNSNQWTIPRCSHAGNKRKKYRGQIVRIIKTSVN